MNNNYLIGTTILLVTACNPTDNPVSEVGCGSDSVCEVFLDTHNDYRADINAGTVVDDGTNGTYPVPSTPLPMLEWNSKLASVAQAHADTCVYEHNSDRQTQYVAAGGENIYVGENIAGNWSSNLSETAEYYATSHVDAWFEENVDWHYQAYNSATINGAGHFTQIIWANTVEIGCGIALCSNFFDSGFDGYYSVCNYGPGGNYTNQYPYEVSGG